jgi:TPR repeat protein
MGKLRYLLIIVLLSLSISLQAKTITIDSIKFQSKDSSLIDMYLAARDQYQVARKHYDSIREGYSNHLATIEDYTKAKEESSDAYEKMLALESKLDIVPTIPEGEPNKWSKDELKQQYAEAGEVKKLLPVIKENSKNKSAYNKRLQNILKQFRGHAAESSILIAIGELNENSPKKAIKYYKEAAKGTVPSGEWNFEQQSACQKLAEMYEKKKQFKQAVNGVKTSLHIPGSSIRRTLA